MELGLVTLTKVILTLLVGIGTVPVIFFLAGGDRSEPKDPFGTI
jgi:hypothetical protein